MVKQSDQQLDSLFHALADPTRRHMLQRLAQTPQTVSALAQPFSMSLAAASKHIKVLERAGLVRREVQGRTHTCRLDAHPMHGGLEWIRHYERFWTERLDTLEALLQAEDRKAAPSGKSTRKPKRSTP